MSSPLFRCRVRDLASCFYACRLPLEEEQQPEILCRKSPEMPSGSIDGAGKSRRKTSTANKRRGESLVQTSTSSSSTTSSLYPEPRFAEEEYIVFCFREDGGIDMMNEGRPSDQHDRRNLTTSAVTPRKVEEKRIGTDLEEARARPQLDPIEEPNPKPTKTDSWESSNSNRSDTTSTSSFAFPVLGIEWNGSPVHMPKSEKQSVNLHCCKF